MFSASINVCVMQKNDEAIYKKTPTIKAMMESKEPLTNHFLYFLSENFGNRWREVIMVLQVDQLYVHRMYKDYSDKAGTREVNFIVPKFERKTFLTSLFPSFQVVFQCMKKFFEANEDKARIGWLITLLWSYRFRKTVWSAKEYYKTLNRTVNIMTVD